MEPAIRTKKHGGEFGLMVILNQLTDDYAYAIHSNVGCRLMVYETSSFPDYISGAIKQLFVGVNEEMFTTVLSHSIFGADDMRTYNKLIRNCAYPDEISLAYEK